MARRVRIQRLRALDPLAAAGGDCRVERDRREFQEPGPYEAETAARLLAGALRIFEVPLSALTARKSMRGTHWFGLPALGVR